MNTLLVLYVRTNIDWRTMNRARFRTLQRDNPTARRIRLESRQRLEQAIALWDKTFGMTYFRFRQRVKEIAGLNWGRIARVDMILQNPSLRGMLSGQPDWLALPVDDDDWFHPRIDELLRAAPQPADAYYWADGVHGGIGNKHAHAATSPRLAVREISEGFFTNNYCVTSRGYAKCSIDEAEAVLDRHAFAGKLFRSPRFERVLLPGCMSVTNKTIASSLNLATTMSPEIYVHRLEQQLNGGREIPRGLRWAAPYVDRMERLNRNLLSSSRRQRA